MSIPLNWKNNKPKVDVADTTDLIAGKFGSNKTPGYIKAEDLRGYKVYSFFLTQSGTNPPTEQTLVNELGLGNITWVYTGDFGEYTGILNGLFVDPTKVFLIAGPIEDISDNTGAIVNYKQIDTNSFRLMSAEPGAFGYNNNNFLDTLIEIRVYP
jgi:hypothetical protein